MPIPKIGENASGRIPFANAVAAHPKDAASIFKYGIHRLVSGPGVWFGKVVMIAPITPMSGGVFRTIVAEHSGKAALTCREPHVAGSVPRDPIDEVVWQPTIEQIDPPQ